MNFEEALKSLEKIVEELEAKELPLEEALRLFEEGVSRIRQCHRLLEEAEKRIEVLIKDEKGIFRLTPFYEEGRDEE